MQKMQNVWFCDFRYNLNRYTAAAVAAAGATVRAVAAVYCVFLWQDAIFCNILQHFAIFAIFCNVLQF